MSDRFDLEQRIMAAWDIIDDIDLLYEKVGNSGELDKDEILNYLLGLKTIYQIKFQRVFSDFEKVMKNI